MSNDLKYRPVLSKIDFVRRYQLMEFGNCSPTWNTMADWARQLMTLSARDLQGDGEQLYHLRNKVAGGDTWYDLKPNDVFNMWYAACPPHEFNQFYVSAMAPTAHTIINAEVMEGIGGLQLYYSTVRKPMRDALREQSRQVYGVVASEILKHCMPTKDYEWLQALLERYPEHVVEFSTYDKEFGTVPGFKTCYWEVRKY